MKFSPSRLSALATVLLFVATFPAFGQQPAGSPPILPDPKLTPGDVLDVTLADIQVKGYSAKVRNVPVAVKREVYASYGIQHWTTGEYEIDHLVSLSLGGSNSKKNLWPQSCKTQPWNAHTKDQLEDRLLALVRAGKVGPAHRTDGNGAELDRRLQKVCQPHAARGEEKCCQLRAGHRDGTTCDCLSALWFTSAHGDGRRHRASVGEHQKRRHLETGQRVLRENEGRQIHERGRRTRRRIPRSKVTTERTTAMPHSNQKLTHIIAGRTISGTSQADGLLTITFDDGSVMKIKTAATNTNSAATGGKVAKVRQGGTELDFDLEGGATVTIQTAEATSSVMLRDKAGKLEYAD